MIVMLNRFRAARADFPSQYWLLFCGLLVSFTGSSLVWPFLLLYISRTLSLPLSSIAWLLTLNWGLGLISSYIAGPIADRLGRKWVMVVSLLANGAVYLLYINAHTLTAFAIVGALGGIVSPIYKVSANAMISDMVPEQKRAEAFALMRMSLNAAVAIGPLIGGFLVAGSYDLAFYGAAAGSLLYGLLLAFLGHETLPDRDQPAAIKRESMRGYGKVLRDRHFLAMVGSLTLTQLCAGIMWNLLSVFTNTEYNLSEKAFGWIPMTNALMVVFIQVIFTSQTKRYPSLAIMSIGSFFFAIGVGSVALGGGFWAFWMSMVVMTIGELMVIPTADTYAANLAPIDMRARYMSITGFAWSIGNGIGPMIGGYLNDAFNPNAIWYGGFALATSGALGFLLMETQKRRSGRPKRHTWARA